MSEDPAPPQSMLRFARLPMAENRTEAYRIIREAGPITKSPRGYVLSSSDYVQYALKNPELFSSRRAFDLVGSPLPMVLDPQHGGRPGQPGAMSTKRL